MSYHKSLFVNLHFLQFFFHKLKNLLFLVRFSVILSIQFFDNHFKIIFFKIFHCVIKKFYFQVIVLYRTTKTKNSLNRTNQSTIIKEAINSYLDKGVTDKQDIYTKVVDELGVPRPTVRRVARDLRTELLQKIQILQSDMPKPTHEEND